MEILTSKMNHIEILSKKIYSMLILNNNNFKDLHGNIKNIGNDIKKSKLENNFNEIEDTVNNIKYSNEKINKNINTIINYNKSNISNLIYWT